MTKSKTRRITPSFVLSCFALFIAMTGGAYALSIPKNSISSKHVVNSSLKGGDIKNDDITNKDVKESTLKQVPSAALADNATNANNAAKAVLADTATNAKDAEKVDGLSASAFERSTLINYGEQSRTSPSKLTLHSWTAASFRITTDGDADGSLQVRVKNANGAGDGDLILINEGTVAIITEGNDPEISAPVGKATMRFAIADPTNKLRADVTCHAIPVPTGPIGCFVTRSQPS